MRTLLLAAALLGASVSLTATFTTPAQAQATCRQKCMDEENACLQRTGNKGQCGGRAQSCAANCR